MLGLLIGLGLLELWHLIYPRLLIGFGTLMEFQVRYLASFLSNRWLRVVLDGKSSQEYPVNAGVPQGSILGCTLFLLYINDLPGDVICDIAIYADDTLYSKCDQVSDLWQQLELASELEADLQDLVNWGNKWLADFIAGKTQLVLFDWSNNGSIDVKIDGSVLKTLNFMAPFYGWGSTGSRLQPLKGSILLFTTKLPEIPGTHFINL